MIRHVSLLRRGLLALGAVALFLSSSYAGTSVQQAPPPQVEVVFVVDTTGSMGGLIDAAKQKIWSISNQIAAGTPTPVVKVGLVAFRDRGDVYITKICDLTEDLDAVHTQLMTFKAAGGGDYPESVNQALYEAVTEINWSKDKKTLKLIFLVGDAPPHMDYAGERRFKYPDTCQLAVKKDIIINTVQCGKHPKTKEAWLHIARLGEGQYVQIDDKGGPVVVVETPYDKDLAKINEEMTKATLIFGNAQQQMQGKTQQAANLGLKPDVAADRAAYYANAGRGATYDLLECVKNGSVKLEELKKEYLPLEMRSMTLDQQRAYLAKLDKDRQNLNAKAKELDKKRMQFIADKVAEQTKNPATDSFDGQVLRLLQTQATRIQVYYGAPAKK